MKNEETFIFIVVHIEPMPTYDHLTLRSKFLEGFTNGQKDCRALRDAFKKHGLPSPADDFDNLVNFMMVQSYMKKMKINTTYHPRYVRTFVNFEVDRLISALTMEALDSSEMCQYGEKYPAENWECEENRRHVLTSVNLYTWWLYVFLVQNELASKILTEHKEEINAKCPKHLLDQIESFRHKEVATA